MSAQTEKDSLFEEAKEKFDVKLDRRLKLSDLKDQLERLAQDKENPPQQEAARRPKIVRNIFTGNEFGYSDLFSGNPDLEIIEWETDDGDN